MVGMPNRERWPAQDDRPRTWVFTRWPDGRGGQIWHGVKHADVAADDLDGTYAPELRLTPDEWATLPHDHVSTAAFQDAVDALAWPEGGRK